MKKYDKTYEDVFTAERSLKKCKIENVSTDIDMETNEYMDLFRNTVLDYQKIQFDRTVKIYWLMRRFCYDGVNREKMNSNGRLDHAFAIFMRHHVGLDNRLIFRDPSFYKVYTYIKDFFPDIDCLNPFEDKFEYPYKHVSLEFLILVYQMSERLDILKYAENNKMKYTEFLDYIINYIYSYNEDIGEEKYIFSFSKSCMPYVKVNKNNNYEGTKETKTSDICER